MAKFTTAEYFEKWDEVRKSFREDPDRTVTSADVRKVLEENGVPAEAIDAYFTSVIEYVDGKHVSEIDHEVMKGFIEEIYVVFKESGIVSDE